MEGGRYISRLFHLTCQDNCTVSAKHSVNALKGLIYDPMETVMSLKTPLNTFQYNLEESLVIFNIMFYSSC